MNPPLLGSACGFDVGTPQISRFRSGRRLALPPPPGNAIARSTVPMKRSKKRTGCPLNSLGAFRRVNSTTSVAYVGLPTCGDEPVSDGSLAGNVEPFTRVAG